MVKLIVLLIWIILIGIGFMIDRDIGYIFLSVLVGIFIMVLGAITLDVFTH
jgi:membrane-bound metal-dependent hydrolase YbcI (DUF457 family)